MFQVAGENPMVVTVCRCQACPGGARARPNGPIADAALHRRTLWCYILNNSETELREVYSNEVL